MRLTGSVAASLLVALMAMSAPAATSAQGRCESPRSPADPPAVTGGNGALSAPQPGPAPTATPVMCWTGFVAGFDGRWLGRDHPRRW